MGWVPPLWWPRASGVRPHSLWLGRTGKGNVRRRRDGDVWEPRVAAECTHTERKVGRCSRPTVRPGRTVNDERDHGAGSDTRPRGRRTSGSLTETRVRDSQYLPERFDGSADRPMNPCSLDGTDQRARTVLAACVEPDGPADADGDQALVIDDARHPTLRCAWGHANEWRHGRRRVARADETRGRRPDWRTSGQEPARILAVEIAWPAWRVLCSAAWNRRPSVVVGKPARPTVRAVRRSPRRGWSCEAARVPARSTRSCRRPRRRATAPDRRGHLRHALPPSAYPTRPRHGHR